MGKITGWLGSKGSALPGWGRPPGMGLPKWYLRGLYWDLSSSLTFSNDEEDMTELSKFADDYKWGTS